MERSSDSIPGPNSSASGTAVRTRFAPSPTGGLHLGGARTALFNFLIAKKQHGSKGSFVLRVEDTDLERSEERFITEILRDLRWLGLFPDEGEGIGGSRGPYRQTQRQQVYEAKINQLKKEKKIYPCFCSKQRLHKLRLEQEKRKLPPRYDGRCFGLTAEEVSQETQKNDQPVWRFHIPRETTKAVEFNDLVHGAMTFKTRDLEDFVVLRSDGTPPFILASLVDDIEMGITDVLRGDDHLTNTPKQILLAQNLGLKPPRYGHVPLVLGADGGPLAKRHGHLGIAAFRERGFLPEAVTQGLLLLGWTPPAGTSLEEAWSLAKQIELFSLERIGKSPSRVDEDRMLHLNHKHLQEVSSDFLQKQLMNFCEDTAHEKNAACQEVLRILCSEKQSPVATKEALQLIQTEFSLLAEMIRPLLGICYGAHPTWTNAEVFAELLQPKNQETLNFAAQFLQANLKAPFSEIIRQLKDKHHLGGKSVFLPLRIALSGRMDGPKLSDLFSLLDPPEALRRLQIEPQ